MFRNYIIKVVKSVCNYDKVAAELRHEIDNIATMKVYKDSLVDCAVCGCAVRSANAIVGEKYIAQIPDPAYERWLCNMTIDVVKVRYYCKQHAPKQGKKK